MSTPQYPQLHKHNVSKSAFISPKVEMPKPSESNRYFSEPLMLLVGKRKYKGQYNFHRRHFSKVGYHIENYIFPDENVIGWKYL